MKKLLMINLLILTTTSKSFAFLQILEKGISVAENTAIYTDAALELAESLEMLDEGGNEILAANKNINDIRQKLRELNYTEQEINDILQAKNLKPNNLAQGISHSAKTIKRAKNLYKKIMFLSVVKPETVTAGESIKTNSILSDLLMEQRLARMDRMSERQDKLIAQLKEEKKQKELNMFIKDQFALMQKKGTSKMGFVNFKVKEKAN
jgi:hypothetical protein